MATGNHVACIHQGRKVHGYGTISNQKVALTKPNWKSVKAERATAVERNHGYQVTHPGKPSPAISPETSNAKISM